MSDNYTDQQDVDQETEEVSWHHLDYYVRRINDEIILVQTALRINSEGEQEICTFYIDDDQLDEDWFEAVQEQGEHLEEGKSADFVPPDEQYAYEDNEEEED